MSLFRTELIRFWSRRITWATLALAAAAMLLAVGIGFFRTSADAPTAGRSVNEGCVRSMIIQFEAGEFEDDPFFGAMGDDEFREFARNEMCTDFSDGDRRFWALSLLGPESDDWSENRRNDYGNGDQNFERDLDGQPVRSANEPLTGVIPGVAIAFLLISVVLGASFMGAEYRSGTVENLLLWEPRRTRVLVTKYVAGFVSSMAATALALGFLIGLLLLLASVHGTFTGVDGRFWIDLASVVTRASLAGGAFFVMSMAIATIFKNTTAAVGAILGWFVLSNVLIGVFLKSVRQYELFINATAFVGEAETPRIVKGPFGDIWAYSHNYLTAGLYVLAWALIPAAIALATFNRRDMT